MRINILKSIIATSLLTVTLSSELLAQDSFTVHGISKSHLEKINKSQSHDIEEYAYYLQTALEKDGYFLTRVENHDNNIYIDLGVISNIKVVGIEGSNKKMVTRYISTLQEGEVTLDKVDRVLTLINSIPGVSVTFAFQRDDKEGSYTIIASGDEIKQNGGIAVDNIPTRIGESTRFSLSQNIYSVLTSGDELRFSGSHIEDDKLPSQTGFSISYQDALEFNGGYWEVTYGDNQSKTNLYSPITGTTLNDYDGQYATVSFAQPIIVGHNQESFLIAQYEYSDESTENLGDITLNMFRVSYFDLCHGNNGDSVSYGVTLSHGKYKEHYNNNNKTSFNHVRIGGGYITPIGNKNKTEFRAEVYAQIGSKNTVDSELFYLGSENFLRGYQPGYFVGESGYTGSLEVAHAFNSPMKGVQRLTPYVFTDFGSVFNDTQNINNVSREKQTDAYSIGVGAKVYIENNFFLETWLAKPLADDYNNKDINPSVYVQLQYNW